MHLLARDVHFTLNGLKVNEILVFKTFNSMGTSIEFMVG
jgi:hypothetical protein